MERKSERREDEKFFARCLKQALVKPKMWADDSLLVLRWTMQTTRQLICFALLLVTLQVRAQDTWVGEVVMPKRNATLKIGNETIDDDQAVYRITQQQDGWLWTGKGWIHETSVVRMEDAPEYYSGVVRQNRGDAWAYNMRGIAWTNRREYQKAIEDFSVALRLDSNNSSSYANRGAAWLQQGAYEQAIRDLTQAIRLEPDHAAAFNSRGIARRLQGDLDGAIEDFTQAIQIDPDYAGAHSNRGECHEQKGRYRDALGDYGKAIELESRLASAYALRARLLAACPEEQFRDGIAAIESATTACELTEWKHPSFLATLAAAYAEAEEFDKAVQWQEKANDLSAENVPQEFQDRLELYRHERPYRMANDA